MVDFKYSYKGIDGYLSVCAPEVCQRIIEHRDGSDSLYLVDELVSMLFKNSDRVLAADMPAGQCKTAELLANLNNLSDIYICTAGSHFQRIA